MNREIKFRAWNKERNIMCYDAEDNSEYYFDGIYSSDLGLINDRLNNSDKYLYQQYIGVKDMHGVEIYEGDLAPCIYHFTGCNGVLEVIYNEYRASFMVKHHGDCQQKMVEKLISDFARQTIIGNIHQHPELLNS